MSLPEQPTAYLAAVMTLYVQLPETPMRISLADRAMARRLFSEGVPLETVEAALLLGSVRRLIRPKDAPTLSPIRSLAYFQPIIEELIEHPAPKSYLDCLRLKLQQAAKAVSANVQKVRS